MSDPRYTTTIALRDGRRVTLRPLQATDVEPLAAFFLGLSAETKRLYGPHPFDRPTAERFCAQSHESIPLRFIAVLDDGADNPTIIGYVIFTRRVFEGDQTRYGGRLRPEECGCLAPGIADAYQNQGLGTQMGRHILACARTMGLSQMILQGGVYAINTRAIHFYEKLGFQRVGQFTTYHPEPVLSYAMLVELDGEQERSADNT